jgi:alkylation response protein AidB-like acyl-CoA dehydrogenase
LKRLWTASFRSFDKPFKRSDGLSVFIVDLREAKGHGLTIRPIRTMMNHATTEVFFDNLKVPAENLIGEEGKGFRYIISGMNAERVLIAAECIGGAKWFIQKAASYSKERVLFGRPIGQNQGVQFPIARAYAQMRAAELMVHHAASLYDTSGECGAEGNEPQSSLRRLRRLVASFAALRPAGVLLGIFLGGGFDQRTHKIAHRRDALGLLHPGFAVPLQDVYLVCAGMVGAAQLHGRAEAGEPDRH